jgi:sirohydrochlorin ferrochelatase
MRMLILVAHGSRREASNQEIRALTEALARRAGERFDRVSCAFLELAEPSIPDAIEQALASGASEVVVLPYFLSAGRHMAEHIPALVEEKRREHPGAEIKLTPYLGAAPGVIDLLLAIADRVE